eukprot:4042195-Amphidinium_carterae.2
MASHVAASSHILYVLVVVGTPLPAGSCPHFTPLVTDGSGIPPCMYVGRVDVPPDARLGISFQDSGTDWQSVYLVGAVQPVKKCRQGLTCCVPKQTRVSLTACVKASRRRHVLSTSAG